MCPRTVKTLGYSTVCGEIDTQSGSYSTCSSGSQNINRNSDSRLTLVNSTSYNQLTIGEKKMLIFYPLTPKSQPEHEYPKRLILGLWRVYGQLVIKMSKFNMAKCKLSFGEMRYLNNKNSKLEENTVINRRDEFSVNSRCVFDEDNDYNDAQVISLQSSSLSVSNNNISSNYSNNNNNCCESNEFSQKYKVSDVSSKVHNHISEDSESSSQVLKSSKKLRNKSWKESSSRTSTSNSKSVRWSMGSWVFLVLFYLLVLGPESTLGCGPGRGAGRRRAPRKLTPLVYKQHVPNVPENTLSASGLNEGRITRDHQRFKNLVPNYNQDIIFRDDEGTGADRLMTQRCKEKLNTLAISVMNQWPGVKLRVIEGWDEENLHATHSLHYEGRAVDITTSDKDRSKYGMLARLAVEAGFDWVYYESRAHIHCSVKSDSTQAGRTGGCFSGNSTVETPTGRRKVSEVNVGDKVLTVDSEGKESFSEVLLFLDRNTSETREFFELKTASGATITLTPSHLMYTVQPEALTPDEQFLFSPNNFILQNQTGQLFLNKAVISFAKNVQIGDWVLVKNSNKWNNSRLSNFIEEEEEMNVFYSIEKVIDMEARIETGVYAPLTSTGNLLVDNVLASCYALIDDQDLAHTAFLPVRLTHNLVKGVSHLWRQFSHFITFSHSKKPTVNEPLSTTISSTTKDDTTPGRKAEDNTITWESDGRVKVGKSGSSLTLLDKQGVHWYAESLYTISKYLLPSHFLYDD